MLSLSTLLALPLVLAVVGSLVVSVVLWLKDLWRRRPCLPALHCRDSALNSRLLARCGLKHRAFTPACWLASPHLQTLLAACWPRGGDGQEATFQREYLQMRDKGVVALDWAVSVQPRVKRKATVLLLLPPVTGDAHSVSALCHLATKRGFRTVVFNRRGHGTSVLTTPKLLNAADPSDLRQVVKYLRLRFPKSRLAAVAYGTGCGLLISYLGEFGSSALLSAGACVSPCYDTVEKFSGALRSVYDVVHLLRLKWILLQHARALSAVLDVKRALLHAWSFRAYEEAVYCRMYNYVTRSDSASRGPHPAVAVSVNGVAATPASSGSGACALTGGKSGSGGGPRCGEGLSASAAASPSGAANGNVVTETPPGVVSVSSSQSVSTSHTPVTCDAASKGGQVCSRALPPPPASLASSPSHVTSSILKQKPSHPVTEVLRKPSSSPSSSASPSSSSPETVCDVRKATVMDSVSDTDPAARSECQSKSTTSSRLASVSTETSMSLSQSDSVFEGSPETSAHLSSSSSVGSRSRSSSTSRSKLASGSVPPAPPSLPPTAPPSSSPSTHSPPPSPPSSPPPPSPSSAGPLEEYWERTNPIRDVDDIAVPVLCINSLDDPFFPTSSSSSSSSSSTIPYDLFRCFPNFLLVVTERGGHCGFLERYPFKSWADLLCLDYLEAVFELTTRGYVTTSSATPATGHASSGASSSSSSSSSIRRNTRSTI